MDFTLNTYRKLLSALRNAGYVFVTFEEWCEGKKDGKIVILRHDIDRNANRSQAIANIEKEQGIKSTYYFRAGKAEEQTDIIRKIVALGHEVGYHYDELSIFKGDYSKSIAHFQSQLIYFRQFYPVRTICMHGSPASKYDNRDLWKKFDYHDSGIIGEPYFDFLTPENLNKGMLYFTDTARMWDGGKYNVRDKAFIAEKTSTQNKVHIHSTFDLINWLEKNDAPNTIMITSHPQRWTDNLFDWLVELISQSLKNKLKRLFLISH